MNQLEQKLYEHIVFIYGEEQAGALTKRILEKLERFREQRPDLTASSPADRVGERDTILITYGDMVQADGQSPLHTLAEFLQEYLADVLSAVHILPFFPYSSDDGFSIIDYKKVNPDFGDWDDVEYLGQSFRLMFDAVVNHVSAHSDWFQGFLRDDPKYRDYFTVVEQGTDLSQVFRPRAQPVLTPFETAGGNKLVWTTFSSDQIDLNFSSPEVLIEVIDIMLSYAAHGAEFIRLDAVTFVWKEIGTTCANMPRTHRIVQLMRTVLDIAAPKVAVITETNVPHKDNIAYFGDGDNEAQMVYNFALPLLTLHAFQKEDVGILSAWAETLDLPSEQATFFNFLACHDGIGLMPVKDILSSDDLNEVVARTQSLGGNVSYKSNADGSQSPYELNINYLDALSDPEAFPQLVKHMDELNINYLDALSDPGNPESDVKLVAKRFLATQSIMLALRGVPGIYFHSLFGSRNWKEGVEQTGRNRTINREKLQLEQLERELADPDSLRHHVFYGFRNLLKERSTQPAFHPTGGQKILSVHPAVFVLLRTSPDECETILCLHNVTGHIQKLTIAPDGLPLPASGSMIDILSKQEFGVTDGQLPLTIQPYQVLWLKRDFLTFNVSR